MTERDGRDWFARHRPELVPLVAISVAVMVVGAGLLYGYRNKSATGDQAISRPVKLDGATAVDGPVDLDALQRDLKWRRREIVALREYVRGFEWGIQNLQRNISRIEFSIDQLTLGEVLPGTPYDTQGGSRADRVRELGVIRVDFEKQIGRAGASIERFKREIRGHETAIERILSALERNAAGP